MQRAIKGVLIMKRTFRALSSAAALLALLLALAACGAATYDNQPAAGATAAVGVTTPQLSSDDITGGPAGSGPGIDQTRIDVCALLPRPQIEAVIGVLTKLPQPTIAIGDEVGCKYVVDQGRAYSVTIYNLDRWELLPTFLEVEPFEGLGDGAYSEQRVGGATALYVLLRNRAVVGVDVNGADTPQLRQLLDLALNNLRTYAA
jgi:hypothetical protein